MSGTLSIRTKGLSAPSVSQNVPSAKVATVGEPFEHVHCARSRLAFVSSGDVFSSNAVQLSSTWARMHMLHGTYVVTVHMLVMGRTCKRRGATQHAAASPPAQSAAFATSTSDVVQHILL